MLDAEFMLKRGAMRIEAALQIAPGETLALFGRSGAGKTSIADAIAGHLRPQQGHIRFGEAVWLHARSNSAMPPHRRRIGQLHQDGRLFPHLSVAGNLGYGQARRDQAALEAMAQRLGIADLLPRKPLGLSGGERQRVALGRALLRDPALLILDEPFAALDLARRDSLIGLLQRIQSERPLPRLLISHQLEEVLRLADRVALVDNGRIAATGPVAETLNALPAPLGDLQTLIGSVIEAELRDGGVWLGPHRLAGHGTIAAKTGKLAIRIAAEDVAIALSRQSDLSIQNQLPARILSIDPLTDGAALVTLDAGQTLRARLTAESVARLGLAPGQAAVALFKAVSLDRALDLG